MFIILAGLHFISIFQGFKTPIATKQCTIILKSVAEQRHSLHDILIGFLFLSSMPQYTFVRILTIA